MPLHSKSRVVLTGSPTASTSEEWGVARRFSMLLAQTSLKGSVVMDIGCGFGAYSKFASKCGAASVVGIDLNREYLKRHKFGQIVNASTSNIPFIDSHSDIALMVEVLEHISNEIVALKEVNRILRKKGLLLITVPNKFYPFETHGLKINSVVVKNLLGIGIPFLSWIPSFLRKYFENARIYNVKGLVNLLCENGFRPLIIDYMMPPLDNISGNMFGEILRKFLSKIERSPFKYFGCHILVLAEKK